MDLSHSSRHLPGRLAVLVLRDGDKTPVSAAIGGGPWSGEEGDEEGMEGGRKDRRGMRGGLGGWMDFLKC